MTEEELNKIIQSFLNILHVHRTEMILYTPDYLWVLECSCGAQFKGALKRFVQDDWTAHIINIILFAADPMPLDLDLKTINDNELT